MAWGRGLPIAIAFVAVVDVYNESDLQVPAFSMEDPLTRLGRCATTSHRPIARKLEAGREQGHATIVVGIRAELTQGDHWLGWSHRQCIQPKVCARPGG